MRHTVELTDALASAETLVDRRPKWGAAVRASQTRNGVTLRVIAGTYNVVIGIDLEQDKRKGCLGFSIRREDLDAPPDEAQPNRWLPNMLKFPTDKTKAVDVTTETAPLQKFRWGDYTCKPATRYRYQVVPRYGKPGSLQPKTLTPDDGAIVEVTTESLDLTGPTAVFFNRGAAASRAFDIRFPKLKTESQVDASLDAKKWLSRGLEEALIAFIAQAKDKSCTLHAAIYEFQKAEFIGALANAQKAGAKVGVVIHARKKNESDTTITKNRAALAKAKPKLTDVVERDANPQSGIMHNKFVVLLEDDKPISVWTGSTNWTDGAVYGQLNVGHAINDPNIAAKYEDYYQTLHKNPDAEDTRRAVELITPVSHLLPPGPGVTPIFSPQSEETMLDLYADVCTDATSVLVCAPFALSPVILKALAAKPDKRMLRFLLLDKEGSLGNNDQEVRVIENDPATSIGIAVTMPSPLHDFQGDLLEGKEAWRHAGVHIHAKLIIANPFSSNPTIVMGSANFSHNSTCINDSNSIVFRGNTALADIYTTEYMRMFEHYHFRAFQAKAEKKRKTKGAPKTTLSLVEDDSWTAPFYVAGSHEEFDRMTFAGTVH